MKTNMIAVAAIATVTTLLAVRLLTTMPESHHAHDEHHDHAHDRHEEEYARGPHGGRVLEQGDFKLEVTLYERGLPPEFSVQSRHHAHHHQHVRGRSTARSVRCLRRRARVPQASRRGVRRPDRATAAEEAQPGPQVGGFRQDGLFELQDLSGRFQADFAEHTAQFRACSQRLHTPPAKRQRRYQEIPDPLPMRVLLDHGGEHPHYQLVITQDNFGFE